MKFSMSRERTMNELPYVRPWDQAKTYSLLANVASLINLAAPAPMSSPNKVVMALWKTQQIICQVGNEVHRGEAILAFVTLSLSPFPR